MESGMGRPSATYREGALAERRRQCWLGSGRRTRRSLRRAGWRSGGGTPAPGEGWPACGATRRHRGHRQGVRSPASERGGVGPGGERSEHPPRSGPHGCGPPCWAGPRRRHRSREGAIDVTRKERANRRQPGFRGRRRLRGTEYSRPTHWRVCGTECCQVGESPGHGGASYLCGVDGSPLCRSSRAEACPGDTCVAGRRAPWRGGTFRPRAER